MIVKRFLQRPLCPKNDFVDNGELREPVGWGRFQRNFNPHFHMDCRDHVMDGKSQLPAKVYAMCPKNDFVDDDDKGLLAQRTS